MTTLIADGCLLTLSSVHTWKCPQEKVKTSQQANSSKHSNLKHKEGLSQYEMGGDKNFSYE